MAKEVLDCHRRSSHHHADDHLDIDPKRTNSLTMELGIACGEDLGEILKFSVDTCRRAFEQASHNLPSSASLQRLCQLDTALTGLSLLYGPSSYMSPHYDSPTQPGQREEWLCMFTMGLPCVFRLDDKTVEMKSGDALVMDSMAVLHGVERIAEDSLDGAICSRLGLPTKCRLGLLFWQGRSVTMDAHSSSEIPIIDGLTTMFADAE